MQREQSTAWLLKKPLFMLLSIVLQFVSWQETNNDQGIKIKTCMETTL